MRKRINEQPVLSGAAKKVESKLDKIPGLDDVLALVKGKANGAPILLQIAETLGGEKELASGLLLAALNMAKKKEAETKNNPAPGAAPAPLNEFVSYLFEETEY